MQFEKVAITSHQPQRPLFHAGGCSWALSFSVPQLMASLMLSCFLGAAGCSSEDGGNACTGEESECSEDCTSACAGRGGTGSGGGTGPGTATGGGNGGGATGGDDGDDPGDSPVNADGLMGYWPLDGDLSDASGLNPDGIFGNNPRYASDAEPIPLTFVSGLSGQAIDFRGDGRKQMPYVDTQLKFRRDAPRTFSVFVKTEDFERELGWVGSGAPDRSPGEDGNRCYLGTQEQDVFAGAGTTFYRSEVTYPKRDSGWHHYAYRVTGDSGSFDVFQDGVKIVDGVEYRGSTATDSGEGEFGTPRGFVIGMAGGRANHPSNAIIDDVAVFGRQLTDAEIVAISDAGSVGAWLAE